MSLGTEHERRRFEEFYRRKWAGHEGFWLERYPADQRVYATTVYRRRNEAIVRVAGSGSRALDIGCGVGDVAALLAARGFRVQAVDPSEENVRRAGRNLGDLGARACVGAAEALPYEDRTFDVVVLADVIEHVGSIDGSLAEARRVLRPGGRVICVTPIRGALAAWRFVDRLAWRLAGPTRRGGQRPAAGSTVHERFLSVAELRRALERAGLSPVAFERVCFYPAPETVGAFGAFMARRARRSPRAFERAADRAIRAFDAVAAIRVLNQKQLWVAVR
jgi:ubiquinone/menaquinone biosynthesis C-methylase UbiE